MPKKRSGRNITARDIGHITLRDAGAAHVTRATIFRGADRQSLREWWHSILRDHGRYSCYAIVLLLPSDTAAFTYLTEYGKELDLISGPDCLVLALGENEFKGAGFDKEVWHYLVDEHTGKGFSVDIARLFEIEFTKLPCLLIFKDIRAPKHVAIPLSKLTVEEIAARMRLIFSVIQKAVGQGKSPLEELAKNQDIEKFHITRQAFLTRASGYAEKTFEMAMEAWIKATIK